MQPLLDRAEGIRRSIRSGAVAVAVAPASSPNAIRAAGEQRSNVASAVGVIHFSRPPARSCLISSSRLSRSSRLILKSSWSETSVLVRVVRCDLMNPPATAASHGATIACPAGRDGLANSRCPRSCFFLRTHPSSALNSWHLENVGQPNASHR